jgi:hypothetical protein
VPNGVCAVELDFAELSTTKPTKRVFEPECLFLNLTAGQAMVVGPGRVSMGPERVAAVTWWPRARASAARGSGHAGCADEEGLQGVVPFVLWGW